MTHSTTYIACHSTFYVTYDGSDRHWQATQSHHTANLEDWQFPCANNNHYTMVFSVTNIGDDTAFIWACNSHTAVPPPPDETAETLYGFKLNAANPSASPDDDEQIKITNILVVQANTLIADDPKVKLTASHGQGIVSGQSLTLTWDGASKLWIYYPDNDVAAAQNYESGTEILFNNTADPFNVVVNVTNHAQTCSAALYSSSNRPSASGIILACDTNVTEERGANFEDVSSSQIKNAERTFTVNLFTPRDDEPTTTKPNDS